MLAYRFLRYLVRLLLGVFFRQVVTVGLEHVPASGEGPVILVGNHPNSLIDAGLMITTGGRIVHFAAQDGLFKNPLSAGVLSALGAVPIRRRSDHGGDKVDNTRAFDALYAVLAAGHAVGIFPEGLSHDEAALARFKTGAARIALGFASTHELELPIVPCGLSYVRRREFRSRVLVQFGPPIIVTREQLEQHAADPHAAVRGLTTAIEGALHQLTINAPDWQTLRVLEGVRRLYQPPRISLTDRVELARRFTRRFPEVKDEPQVQALYQRVADYQERLEASGLDDRDLLRQPTRGELVWRTLANLALILVWLPLAGPGLLLYGPLGLLVGWAGKRFTPRSDAIATSKLVVGLLVIGPVYLALLLAAAWTAHWSAALLLAVLLPICGHAALQVLERWHALKRVARRGLRWMLLEQEITALRSERAALVERVAEVVERFRPDDMRLLFPPSEREGS